MHPPTVRRQHMQGLMQVPRALQRALALLGTLALWLALAVAAPVHAQGVELATLQTHRHEGVLDLEFAARITLPRAVEDALQRGVTIYFVAEATLLRNRWYWRDERVARVSRSWRVYYQHVTGTWRVSLGGLNQTYATLAEALGAASRSSGWKLADLKELDPDKGYYLEFSYRLDTSQLPGPMQFGFADRGEWTVGASRAIKVELPPAAAPSSAPPASPPSPP